MKYNTLVYSLVIIILFCVTCGDDPISSNPEESLQEYINNISIFPDPPAEYDNFLGKEGDTVDESSAGVMVCSVEDFEMGRNMHEIVAFDPNADALWPGCIVQGQYIPDGILNPVNVPRTPITVGIPNLPGMSGDELSKEISNPTQFKVAGTLNEIIDSFISSGATLPADFSFQSIETYEFEQGMLDLGISADWVGGNLRSRFQYEWESSKNTLLLKFTQKYYTATVDPPSSSVSFFDPNVKVKDIENYTSNGNPLCYVKSVTYGRVGILSMTSTESMSEMKASLDAAFDALLASGSIDSEAEYAKVLKTAEMKLLILGGAGTDDIVSLTDPVSGLMNWINSGMELNENTRGVPISYVVAHLKNNTNARFQYTTSFKKRLCAWADQPAYVSVYQLKCISDEGGAWPALEGWCYVTLTTYIPGLDPIEIGSSTISFSNFDPGETRDITTASWDNPVSKQAGTYFTLNIVIIEDDDVYDDNLGDYTWDFTYPDFNPGTGDCSVDPLRCNYEQVFEYGGQKIIAYFKVHLDGNP